MKFAWIFSDVLENAEKRCNFSEFLDFNLIFIIIIPEICLIFDCIKCIFDLIFNFIFTEPPYRAAEVKKAEQEIRQTPTFADVCARPQQRMTPAAEHPLDHPDDLFEKTDGTAALVFSCVFLRPRFFWYPNYRFFDQIAQFANVAEVAVVGSVVFLRPPPRARGRRRGIVIY